MKLSERQREVLGLMADGWTACWTGGIGAGAHMQKGKIGYGGESRSLTSQTLHALTSRKLIQRYGSGIGSTHFKISRRGLEVLSAQ
jgi:succinyl-CoA synthetase alpha subunit